MKRPKNKERQPGRRRRHATAVFTMLGMAAAATSVAGQTSFMTGETDDTPVVSVIEPVGITLSMEVKPGEPVPLELITDKADVEFEDKGFEGQGVDVALIDSGVTPVSGLDQPGKVLHGPDLSNEGAFQGTANLDTYGHGTHLAGIIAGDENAVDGIAPDSRIVSVKVADATGQTEVAQVVAAIDWVVEHKNDNGLNIRVLNLSLGVPSTGSGAGDPLALAVERAWDAGIVVVAAVGNRGNGSGGIDSPAVSSDVIAVGAIESYESHGKEDYMASWSSGGNSYRSPDVVAPGRSIKSFRVPGSMLDQLYPNARVGNDYFLGSGTSQSAAVVSGYAAALLSKAPSLTPDQVKSLFTMTATDLVPGTLLDGYGRINPSLAAMYTEKVLADTSATRLTTTRLASPTLLTTSSLSPIAENEIENENTVTAPSGATWSGGTWSGATWSGGMWSGATWSGATWSGATWSGATWSGATWSGATWSGATWSGATWSGATWSGATWSGDKWSGSFWS